MQGFSPTLDPVILVNGIVTLGAVIGGIKISMNGIHKSLERLEKGQDEIGRRVDTNTIRLTVLETRTELEKLQKKE